MLGRRDTRHRHVEGPGACRTWHCMSGDVRIRLCCRSVSPFQDGIPYSVETVPFDHYENCRLLKSERGRRRHRPRTVGRTGGVLSVNQNGLDAFPKVSAHQNRIYLILDVLIGSVLPVLAERRQAAAPRTHLFRACHNASDRMRRMSVHHLTRRSQGVAESLNTGPAQTCAVLPPLRT